MANTEVVESVLRDRMHELESRIADIEDQLEAPGDDDFAEMVTEGEGDETLAEMLRAAAEEAAQIRLALRRISQGTYGSCEVCGEAIPAARLQLLPSATRCVACAAGVA